MNQAVYCDLFLYADDCCLVCRRKDVSKTIHNLNKSFSNICDCFVDNKLSISIGEDKKHTIWYKT